MDSITRNSRWTRDPVLDDEGKPKHARLTKHDIEIFKILARYRYLSILDIHAFVGGNPKHLSHRLSLLSREPNLYVKRPPQQRENANANYSPLIYELDKKAITILGELGINIARKPPYSFVHELMACQIMASIELGARDAKRARLIEWPEIFEKLPERTRKGDVPHSIPVAYDGNKPKHVRADWLPFGIERQGERKTYIFFPGIEADNGTEPIDASDGERSSINAKFLAYAAIAEQRLYQGALGPAQFLCAYHHDHNGAHEFHDGAPGEAGGARQGRKEKADIFLFKTHPSLTSYGPRPPVNGRMFSEPWQRVGKEPFYMGKVKKHPRIAQGRSRGRNAYSSFGGNSTMLPSTGRASS